MLNTGCIRGTLPSAAAHGFGPSTRRIAARLFYTAKLMSGDRWFGRFTKRQAARFCETFPGTLSSRKDTIRLHQTHLRVISHGKQAGKLEAMGTDDFERLAERSGLVIERK